MKNVTGVTLFTLSGLDFQFEQRIALFFLTLLWYLMILWGNVALIVAIIRDKQLHQPMYIFVCNLCISGLYGTVGFYPKFLLDRSLCGLLFRLNCLHELQHTVKEYVSLLPSPIQSPHPPFSFPHYPPT